MRAPPRTPPKSRPNMRTHSKNPVILAVTKQVPIVVCCLELPFDADSPPGEPCGPGSSQNKVFRASVRPCGARKIITFCEAYMRGSQVPENSGVLKTGFSKS